jgi:hypothetical protein
MTIQVKEISDMTVEIKETFGSNDSACKREINRKR